MRFSKTEGDEAVVEFKISTWRITESGQMSQDREKTFENPDMFINQVKDSVIDMSLNLSHNKQAVTLATINKKGRLNLFAWETKKLKEIEIKQKLIHKINEWIKGGKDQESKILQLELTGNENQYLLLKTKNVALDPKGDEITINYLTFTVFCTKTGRVIYKFKQSPEDDKDVIIFDVHVSTHQEEEKEDDQEEEDEAKDSEDENGGDDIMESTVVAEEEDISDDDQKAQQNDDENQNLETETDDMNLEEDTFVVFFFAGQNKLFQENKQQNSEYLWTYKKIPLLELRS